MMLLHVQMIFIKWIQKHVFQSHGVHQIILLIKNKKHVHLNVIERNTHTQIAHRRNAWIYVLLATMQV